MAGGVVDLQEARAAFDVVDAALDKAGGLNCEALATPELLESLERCERVRRRLPSVEHPLINVLARQATPEELGAKLSQVLADCTLISRAEASRRIKEASDLGPHTPFH
jgi:hypothetical protein